MGRLPGSCFAQDDSSVLLVFWLEEGRTKATAKTEADPYGMTNKRTGNGKCNGNGNSNGDCDCDCNGNGKCDCDCNNEEKDG
jgi:hypothetical protein